MSAELTTQPDAKLLEQVLIGGDLGRLTAAERMSYYTRICESLGLNPLAKPFEYILLNGKLRLYALRDCAEQLRKIHGVSVTGMHMETIEGVYVVRADFTDKTGRTDQATGAVPIAKLTGEALANAFMKAETKCKRRGTLSICGLGMLDETEVETIPGAKVGEVDTGPPPLPKRLSEKGKPLVEVLAEPENPPSDLLPPDDLPISKQESVEIYRAMRVMLRELELEPTDSNLARAKNAVKTWAAKELGIEHLEDCPQGKPYLRLRGEIGRLVKQAFPMELK